MAYVNENYLNVSESYLFSTIAAKIRGYLEENPEAPLIRLGIGDVTLPLPACVLEALHQATEEMGRKETFKGYGPEQGYEFLRECIAEGDYAARGIVMDASEIFVSDGSKCDTGNIQEIFGEGNTIAIPDPVYPVYVDTNVMAGKAGKRLENGRYSGIMYIECNRETGFKPVIPEGRADIVYLCYPNNPTGTVLDKKELAVWVDYALKNKVVLLYDAAYEAYISDNTIPRSIYEIDGARECAIEFKSFSKTAGFTGLRCAYTVIPKDLVAYTRKGDAVKLHKLWNRRQSTKFNGVPYITQKAAASLYTEQGRREIGERIRYYMGNARLIRSSLLQSGYEVFGGEHAPYVWLKTRDGMSSWEFFDHLLQNLQIAGTPGSGFGTNGEGYFRLTGFGSSENTLEAARRLTGGKSI
ncbi:MAG TPA: LL-diaminopimelate aminotransferase [Clostridiales bacterium]|nr:LL-diaminopimelate aminotransferase [Clostridiales bacterium]